VTLPFFEAELVVPPFTDLRFDLVLQKDLLTFWIDVLKKISSGEFHFQVVFFN
jgi:hypothetical protein